MADLKLTNDDLQTLLASLPDDASKDTPVQAATRRLCLFAAAMALALPGLKDAVDNLTGLVPPQPPNTIEP